MHVDATEVDFADPRVELSVVAGTAEQEFGLERVLVSHGVPIETPQATLRQLAQALT